MTIRFQNLTPEEEKMLYALEEENPECMVRKVNASFDGMQVVELTLQYVIPAVAAVIVAILEYKGKKKEDKNPEPSTGNIIIMSDKIKDIMVLSPGKEAVALIDSDIWPEIEKYVQKNHKKKGKK